MGSAVALADGVWRVPTAPADLVNSYLLREPDGGFTLVDAGLRRAHKPILAALAALGAGPSDVRRILLTHAHGDHAGGLAEVVRRTAAPVTAHADDAGWVESGQAPPRDRATLLGRLGNRRPSRFEAVPVTHTVTDGDLLDVAGGLRVWHTPGHTPGHVSLRHEPTGVLLTGDAVFNVRGLRWPPRGFCTDIALNRRSADLLGEIDYEVAAFNHGAEIRTGARDAVRAFLRGRPR